MDSMTITSGECRQRLKDTVTKVRDHLNGGYLQITDLELDLWSSVGFYISPNLTEGDKHAYVGPNWITPELFVMYHMPSWLAVSIRYSVIKRFYSCPKEEIEEIEVAHSIQDKWTFTRE